jgi:hypothetical protein
MIIFNVSRYEQIHQKRPRGLGRWTFQIGYTLHTFDAMYSAARNLARRSARIAGESVVEVLP